MIDVLRVDFVAQPVSDLRAAQAWYGDTLGLPRNPSGSGERWVEHETPNLTLALSTFGGAIALRVDDVAEARSLLESAGVEFGGETFDSGVCHGAPLADPFGNRLLLHHRYAPVEPFDAPANAVQRTDYVSVAVPDLERGTAFYGETLGIRRNPRAPESNPEFETANLTISLRAGEVAPSTTYVALRVPDVADARVRLEQEGVEFKGEVYDTGVCHVSFFADPDGNRIALHRRYAD